MFRMRGKGIQNVNGRGRGDQYVRVNIEVPKNLTDKQKKLLEQAALEKKLAAETIDVTSG